MQERIHRPDEGRALDILGNTLLEKAGGDDLGGGAAIYVQSILPQNGPPEHFHAETDEFLYVLEGELDVWIGGRHARLTPGMSTTLPRGVPHRFDNPGPRATRALTVVTPGKGARFFDDIDRERPQMPGEFAKLAAIVGRHDIQFTD